MQVNAGLMQALNVQKRDLDIKLWVVDTKQRVLRNKNTVLRRLQKDVYM
jgi:hypothetical protein